MRFPRLAKPDAWRIPRPNFTLLSKFSLVSLLLMAAIASGLAFGIQHRLETSALWQEAQSAADQVSSLLDPNLTAQDLSAPLDAAAYARLDALIKSEVVSRHIVRVKIWGRDGLVVYSDDASIAGQRLPVSDELESALAGHVAMDVSDLDKAENATERNQYDRLLEVYVPLRPRGATTVMGAYEIYHDMSALQPQIDDMRRFVWGSVGLGFVALYGALFTLVRNASRELERRNDDNARLYRETRRLYGDLSVAYDHTLDALVAALDARDKETKGHSRRVVAYALALARQMSLSDAELETLQRGALLHDIGKIGVPDGILLKPGALTSDEWAVMRRHPEWGACILAPIPFLQGAVSIVCSHQERWDGAGYPAKLAGEAIPVGARIFAVADTFDAITSDRPYRRARPYAAARAEIERCAGTQFDPAVVRAFLRIPEAAWETMREQATAKLSPSNVYTPVPRPGPSGADRTAPVMAPSLGIR